MSKSPFLNQISQHIRMPATVFVLKKHIFTGSKITFDFTACSIQKILLQSMLLAFFHIWLIAEMLLLIHRKQH